MKTEFEEGGCCPDAECFGILQYPPVQNCSCHINAPCSPCVDNRLKCPDCSWIEPEPEYIQPSQAEKDGWAKYMANWEDARRRGHTFAHGGRIFNMREDGRSGSTMVFSGDYEGPVTAADILEYLGDGTFGHRGPSFSGGRFSYTKITD